MLKADSTKRRAGRAGGPCCQMKNMNYQRAGELHRADRQAALQDWLVGCTLSGTSGLHIKLGCGKGRSGGMPFSAARCTAFLCSPPARLSVVFCAARRQFTFFIWKRGPPARPALQLVLSVESRVFTHDSCHWGPFESRELAHCSCC